MTGIFTYTTMGIWLGLHLKHPHQTILSKNYIVNMEFLQISPYEMKIILQSIKFSHVCHLESR